MKKMALFGTIIGVLSFLASMYVHFVLAPAKDAALDLAFSNIFNENRAAELWDIIDFASNVTYAVLLAGIVGLLISIIPAIKKHKLAWVGVILSLIATFVGLIHGTHMFS